MTKLDRIIKLYDMQIEPKARMEQEINCEMEELGVLMHVPSTVSEPLPLPLYNNLLRQDEASIIRPADIAGRKPG